MTKQEFLNQLERELNGLPQEEIDGRVQFYAEMIDDLLDEGLSESEAVKKIGTVEDVVSQILIDNHYAKKNTLHKRKRSALEIILIVLGSPIWVSLLVSAVAVAVSLYVSVWAVIVSFWAVFASFVGGALGEIVSGIAQLCSGQTAQGFMLIAAALVLAGLAIFAFFGCRAVTKCAVKLTKKFFACLKNRFLKKECAK